MNPASSNQQLMANCSQPPSTSSFVNSGVSPYCHCGAVFPSQFLQPSGGYYINCPADPYGYHLVEIEYTPAAMPQAPMTWQQQPPFVPHGHPAAPVKKSRQPKKSVKFADPSKVQSGGPAAEDTAVNQFCRFCRSNREPFKVFTSHEMKDAQGQVICPILFKHSCEICGATGSNAHTKKYCPQVPEEYFEYQRVRTAAGSTTLRKF